MRLIAHRGNVEGSKPQYENDPSYLQEALDRGFDVEIDAWYIDHDWYLGHDRPLYKLEETFLLHDERSWVHAKNLEALMHGNNVKVHVFWHQNDDFTLTSKGYIWTYPGKQVTRKSVIVCKTDEEFRTYSSLKRDVAGFDVPYGICADKFECYDPRI